MSAVQLGALPLEARRMRETAHPSEALARRLRGFLPLSAHCRSPLLKTLRGYAPNVAAPSHVLVTGVYDMGGSVGLMCRIDLGGEIAASAVLVVPITHLAFDRRHPISRDMANYRRLHAGRLEAKGSQE